MERLWYTRKKLFVRWVVCMVSLEEIRERTFEDNGSEETSMRVSVEEMYRFEDDAKKLARKIAARKIQYDKEFNNNHSSYEKFANACGMSASTVKKTISGSIKVTRTFLYRMAVGLHMTIDEANEYFALCGGILREDSSIEDYICIHALKDGDTIEMFSEQVEQFANTKIWRKERNLKE